MKVSQTRSLILPLLFATLILSVAFGALHPESVRAQRRTATPTASAKHSRPVELWPVVDNSKWGYIDKSGKMVVAPKFEAASPFSEGLALVRLQGKLGFINPSGAIIIAARFEEAGSFSEGRAPVFENASCGYIDNRGGYVVEPAYEDCRIFSEKLAPIKSEGLWGFIGLDGSLKIDAKFEDAAPFINGIAAVKTDGKWGFIDPSGAFKIEPSFESVVSPRINDVSRLSIIDPLFKFLLGFSEGLVPVKVGDSWGYADTNGDMVIRPEWVQALTFSDGLASVKDISGRCGYIDKSGQYRIEAGFVSCAPFVQGAAMVDVGGKVGFIDTGGRFLVKPELDRTTKTTMVIRDGIATFGTFAIDKTGKVLWNSSRTSPAK